MCTPHNLPTHTLRMSPVFVNKDMKVTVCRGASGGWEGATTPFGNVKQARAIGSGFKEEKNGHPKHESAKLSSRDVPSFATSCDQSLLTDGFAISGV